MTKAPLLVLVALVGSLCGCTNFADTVKDETKLEGPAAGELGRRLVVDLVVPEKFPGDEPEAARDRPSAAQLSEQFVEAFKAELEGGDLFDEVVTSQGEAAPVGTGARTTRLEATLATEWHGVVHDFWRQRDGYVERYELTARLADRTGTEVLGGHLEGLGWDDRFDCGPLAALGIGWFGNRDRTPESLSDAKKADIRAAAMRDAVQKIARCLRSAASQKARDAIAALKPVHLPPGVGPLPIAVLGFDDDPAARHRRGVAIARATAGALQRMGPDFAVVSQDEVENELGADPTSRPRSFEKLRSEELDRLVPRLGARLYVVGKVSADGNRVEAVAWVKNTRLEDVGEPARAVAEGPGALSLVAVDLAQKLGVQVEKHPPDVLPKKEENE